MLLYTKCKTCGYTAFDVGGPRNTKVEGLRWKITNDLELKQAIALHNFRVPVEKVKINTTCIQPLYNRMTIVEDIPRSRLPDVSIMLTWDEWIECELTFRIRGFAAVVLAVDACSFAGCIIFLGCDGNGRPR